MNRVTSIDARMLERFEQGYAARPELNVMSNAVSRTALPDAAFVPAAAANIDAHGIVPPGGQLTSGVAPGGKVHIHEIHPHRGTDALCGQRPLRRQLKLQKPPCRPCPRLRCAVRRALLHHGQHCVPHQELGALVSHGITGRSDVQPQGVGAQRCPGIQLGAPPAQSLQSAAQRKAHQQVGA